MFTGIIKEIGKVVDIKQSVNGKILTIQCPKLIKGTYIGDSIAVNGCCLTVAKIQEDSFTTDVSFTTLSDTTFKDIRIQSLVNLEDSLKINDKLSGHFVTGHIDCTALISDIQKIGDFYKFKIQIKKEILKYIVPKGSICVDGISLTVTDVLFLQSASLTDGFFTFTIIPHTFENTILKYKKKNDLVNIEVDMLAKYLENLIEFKNSIGKDSISFNDKITNSLNNIAKNKDSIESISDKELEKKLKKYGFFK